MAPAGMNWVTHPAADLDTALDLFAGPLGGQVGAEGAMRVLGWVGLSWDGPLGLRLVAPSGRSRSSTAPADGRRSRRPPV